MSYVFAALAVALWERLINRAIPAGLPVFVGSNKQLTLKFLNSELYRKLTLNSEPPTPRTGFERYMCPDAHFVGEEQSRSCADGRASTRHLHGTTRAPRHAAVP